MGNNKKRQRANPQPSTAKNTSAIQHSAAQADEAGNEVDEDVAGAYGRVGSVGGSGKRENGFTG
ncbi:hypothetical protein BJ508DRAFT_413986 [Ascobolus immersus RN42]|uniref:Uncharacterized protein n=1 Tax=Ascobolus immersus RN42 TaxID=1160509 RepID=A0A3N4IEA5_ASCIM|nr:hypothetical protein BJ508DRAFT_413986 [Ascobolus immersus RN42]